MAEDGIEADTKDSCSVTTPGTIHCHINNGLMNIGFSDVVLKAELEGFQTEPAAIELCARSRVTITDNSFMLLSNGDKLHQSLPSLIQKEKYTAALGWRHDPILESWSQLIKFDKGILT